jgi:hypothetical protein
VPFLEGISGRRRRLDEESNDGGSQSKGHGSPATAPISHPEQADEDGVIDGKRWQQGGMGVQRRHCQGDDVGRDRPTAAEQHRGQQGGGNYPPPDQVGGERSAIEKAELGIADRRLREDDGAHRQGGDQGGVSD